MMGVGCPFAWQLTLMAFWLSRGITATPSEIIGFPTERLDEHCLAIIIPTDPGIENSFLLLLHF